MITHYEVLGVKDNATSKEIKKARKKLALCLHPDKNVGMNEMVRGLVQERFLEVQEAYATLSDTARRKEYDEALGALRSEGEYYIPAAPTDAAPNPPVKPKGPAICDKCQTISSEPMHSICEGCRKRIAALEQEVRARRQLGITTCKLCGSTPLAKSPYRGLCAGCWRHLSILASQQDVARPLVISPRCRRRREAGRYCPDCGLDSVGGRTSRSRKRSAGGGTSWSWKKSVAGMWKPAVGWSIVYLALSLSTGYWKAYLFIALVLLALYSYIKWAVQ